MAGVSYLDISLGSLSELRYAALLAKDLAILNDQQWADYDREIDSAGKLTMGPYKAVAKRVR